MKKQYEQAEFDEIKKQLDKLNWVEKELAEEILQATLRYLEETDLSHNPSDECLLYRGIAFFYINNRDATRANEYLLKAQELANLKGTDLDKLSVEANFGIVYSLNGEHLKAIDIWEGVLNHAGISDDLYLRTLNNLIVAYGFSKQFTKAVDLSYKLLKGLEERNSPVYMVSSAYINLSNAYLPLKKYDQAIKALEHALKLAEEVENYSHQITIQGNLVGIYMELEDLDKAFYHAKKEYETCQKQIGIIQKAEALGRMGDVCIRQNRLDEGESYLLEALEMQRVESNPVSLSDCLMALGKLYIARGELDKAKRYLDEAEPIIMATNVDALYSNFYLSMDTYYLAIKDYANAHTCLNKLLDLNHEQYAQLSENMISVAEAEYLRHQIEKKNQAYQTQNEELQRSMNMLNRLISVLSHDVRGPIANSAQALRLIQEGSLSQGNGQEILGHVIKNLESSSDLLAEMMLWIESRAFSKEVHRLLLNVDVQILLESVITYYQGQLMQKALQLKLNLHPGAIMSYSEPNILKIAMRNILSNAIKYSHKGGNIYISLQPEEKSIVLKIKDEGMGMRPEDLQELKCEDLKPKMGTNQEMGMGMGMRLCFGYLRLLDIGYDISSRESEGTEFTLRLPLAKDEENP